MLSSDFTFAQISDAHIGFKGQANSAQSFDYKGAYIAMARFDDGRAVLARLRPLDPREAEELDAAIAQAARR